MPKSRLPLAILKQNFAELHPRFTPSEATVAAGRCLFCFDAPCTRACPTHIDVPRFIRQILHGDLPGSARTILDANILGGSCARVCPTQVLCEGACVDNTLMKSPVEIGRLQRFACDHAIRESLEFYEAGPDTGRKVAIVGAGPAGLTCAHELRKRGHAVELFEAGELPGGLNAFAIAAYKMDTAFALGEVRHVFRLGARIHLNQPVDGKRLAKLLGEYDAVCLAIGLGKTAPLGIPGEALSGVWEALDYVSQTHDKNLNQCASGRHVVVIGGGNTAIDVANAAVRLGAETVTIAYRRDREAMPAFAHEYDLAVASGVRFEWRAAATRLVGKAGKVAGVRCRRMQMRGRGRSAKLAPVRGSDFTLPADLVIKALGQEKQIDLLSAVPGLKLDRTGKVIAEGRTGATSVAGLFVAGDCRSGAAEEVVYAVQDGKQAAAGIDVHLKHALPRAPIGRVPAARGSRR